MPDPVLMFDEKPSTHTRTNFQGILNVAVNGKDVKLVNIQAQVGKKPFRHSYSYVNVVADKKVGVDIIKQALNESLNRSATRWVIETAPHTFQIQGARPA